MRIYYCPQYERPIKKEESQIGLAGTVEKDILSSYCCSILYAHICFIFKPYPLPDRFA